jgi:hypothetical protein
MFVDVSALSIRSDSVATDLFQAIYLVKSPRCVEHVSLASLCLGNMWAQTWNERFNDLIAYPDAPLIDLTKTLRDKQFSVHEMYKTAEKFFTSIGLYSMTSKFWARSMFEKPKDRDVVCHAAASDFSNHDDYRVKICTEVNEDYFYTIHHEMGHIEYYMAYAKGQPYVYRDGANSAFHEAIGDTIGMYASRNSSLPATGSMNVVLIFSFTGAFDQIGFSGRESGERTFSNQLSFTFSLTKGGFPPVRLRAR